MKISDNVAEEMLNLHVWKQFVSLFNILYQQRCKKDAIKRVVTATRWTIENQYLSKCL